MIFHGEAQGLFLREERVGPVELATLSFGQRFEVTPMQMMKMTGTIANGGIPVTPRLVKATIDTETGERIDFEVESHERVLSEETAREVLSMMETVVDEGTGRNAAVRGYSVGGKTGTSEVGINTNKFIASFVGVASIEDPEVVILVILYYPSGEGGHQGGVVAAPVAGDVLREVLPYLEVSRSEALEIKESIDMPEVTGLTLSEARTILIELGLEYEFSEGQDGSMVVREQLPRRGIVINTGTRVMLETY
ncbi:MAG: penicillin-binding transpeptidase domain-containing protein [Oscillospiraceae bacterium]|nr:penicillin-binding transpeptidase domain-containing protein [Oscillospiraceae bacterium]